MRINCPKPQHNSFGGKTRPPTPLPLPTSSPPRPHPRIQALLLFYLLRRFGLLRSSAGERAAGSAANRRAQIDAPPPPPAVSACRILPGSFRQLAQSHSARSGRYLRADSCYVQGPRTNALRARRSGPPLSDPRTWFPSSRSSVSGPQTQTPESSVSRTQVLPFPASRIRASGICTTRTSPPENCGRVGAASFPEPRIPGPRLRNSCFPPPGAPNSQLSAARKSKHHLEEQRSPSAQYRSQTLSLPRARHLGAVKSHSKEPSEFQLPGCYSTLSSKQPRCPRKEPQALPASRL